MAACRPLVKLLTVLADQFFPVTAAYAWNSVPLHIICGSSLLTFMTSRMACLFSYSPAVSVDCTYIVHTVTTFAILDTTGPHVTYLLTCHYHQCIGKINMTMNILCSGLGLYTVHNGVCIDYAYTHFLKQSSYVDYIFVGCHPNNVKFPSPSTDCDSSSKRC